MIIEVPYGHTTQSAAISDDFTVELIDPPQVNATGVASQLIQQALANLLGGVSWETFRGVESVAIAINDKTRPVPHHLLLPPLLERLAALDIQDSNISFYIATGTHAAMTAGEFAVVLPDNILSRYHVISHNVNDVDSLVDLGQTTLGTRIMSNAAYVNSALKIVVGNIEPHQFAGFSGGVKTAAIGLSGIETINHNHSLLLDPLSCLGGYATNPLRQDIEEIGKKIGIQVALNAVLNQEREIIHVLAGDPVAVMQSGIPLSRLVCQVALPEQYDLVIASPGGHPKDINLYQSQKGFAHAAMVTKRGGSIILVAACPEGTGSRHYEEWMKGKTSYREVIKSFCSSDFQIGPHKAYQIARDASKVQFYFCSEMDSDLAQRLLLNPTINLQTAVNLALQGANSDIRIGVMKHASSTIPLAQAFEKI